MGRLLLGLTWVTGAASLVGFAGRTWWVFDLFTHPRLQYPVVLLLLGAGLATLGRNRGALAAVTIATVNAVVVAPLFLPAAARFEPGSPSLTVASFNVQVGNPDRSSVIEWVRTLDADVVFLWETSGPWRDEFAAADLPFRLFEPLQDGTTIGGLVLTREDAGVKLLETGVRSSIEVRLPFADGDLVVIGAHPFPPVSSSRTAERDRQLQAVADRAGTVNGPVVVAGDLNATPWSSGFRPLLATLVNSMDGHGWSGSYPSGLGPLMIPIDHVLHNNDLVTVGRAVGPDLGSDHLPLVVTVGLRTDGDAG